MLNSVLGSLRAKLAKSSLLQGSSPSPSHPTSPFDTPGITTVTLSPIHASVYTAIRRPVPPKPHSPVIVKLQRHENDPEPEHQSQLKEQLQSIPKDTKYLRLDDETPSDKEWSLVANHFSSVDNLELESGFSEMLNDRPIPEHWPLKRLELRSACGEVVQTPFIREGRVPHLSLLLTSGLRFTGPTTNELPKEHKKDVERGEVKAEHIIHDEGTPEEKKIEVIHVPEIVSRHMNKCSDKELELKLGQGHLFEQTNMRTLEIFENDAIDTFSRMAHALPHVVDNLQTLRIRSTAGLDFVYVGEEAFRHILPELKNLKTLNLTVGNVFQDPEYLPTLHKILPPNLTTLFFRGPTSLCQSSHWSDWVRAFESKDFLPHLQRLSFVLDIHHTEEKNGWGYGKVIPAPAGNLYQGRVACETIYGIARRRGVSIEHMPPEPEAENRLFEPVDDRW